MGFTSDNKRIQYSKWTDKIPTSMYELSKEEEWGEGKQEKRGGGGPGESSRFERYFELLVESFDASRNRPHQGKVERIDWALKPEKDWEMI